MSESNTWDAEDVAYGAATLLASETATLAFIAHISTREGSCLAPTRELRDLLWLVIAVGLGNLAWHFVLTRFARRIRGVASAWLADASIAERMACFVVLVLVFAGPSFFVGRWTPFLGWFSVVGVITAFLVNEWIYAALYVVSGVCHVSAFESVPATLARGHLVGFCTLFVLTMVAERIFFRTQVFGEREPIPASLVWRSVRRPLAWTIAFVTGASIVVRPMGGLVHIAHPRAPDSMAPMGFEAQLSLVQLVSFLLLAIASVALAEFVRRLVSRLWRRDEEVEPPLVDSAHMEEVESEAAAGIRHRSAPRDPREEIANAFLRFSESVGTLGFARQPSETASEYLRTLTTRGVLSPTTALELERSFLRARYAGTVVTRDDVHEFRTLVEKALRECRRTSEA